ncbi:MAG: LuxR C-terminal-related transcriptional regulator, partial [Bacillota bacterium]
SLYYGIGLGVNVWLMSFGEFFVARFLPIGEVGFSNISLVAALILFLGIIGLMKLEETLTHRETLPESVYPEPTPAPELSCNPGQPYQMDTAIDNYVLDLLATEYSLTPRELEVIELLLEGMKNDEIQEKLFISQGTLKTHLRHIFRKLDVQNRKELLVSFTRFLVSSNGARENADPR